MDIERCKRIWECIDLDAARNNMLSMKDNIAPETQMIAVIKADGYGYGSVPLAGELEALPFLFGFATATYEEAETLRDHGIKKPILILGYTFPYCYEDMIEKEIRPAVFRLDMARELSEKAVALRKVAKIHISVDTGMSRIGIQPDDAGIAFVKEVLALPGIEVEGMFTHFAKADMTDLSSAREQYVKFRDFTKRVEDELSFTIPIKHCSNSAGIIRMKEANMDVVRAGITLYGLWPSNEVEKDIIDLKPVMSLKSHIVYKKTLQPGREISYGGTFVVPKEMVVATIPVGYADGYPRSLSGKGYVLIHGEKAPILGRVCMDQMMVDITHIADAMEGDEVTLIGTDGDLEITAEGLGDLSGRFNYELVCDISKRVPRIYYKGGKVVNGNF